MELDRFGLLVAQLGRCFAVAAVAQALALVAAGPVLAPAALPAVAGLVG